MWKVQRSEVLQRLQPRHARALRNELTRAMENPRPAAPYGDGQPGLPLLRLPTSRHELRHGHMPHRVRQLDPTASKHREVDVIALIHCRDDLAQVRSDPS